LDDRQISLEIPKTNSSEKPSNTVTFDAANPTLIASEIFRVMGKQTSSTTKKTEKKKMTVAEAKPLLEEQEAEKLLGFFFFFF
jgi:ATP-dependent protease HslVU (ClpYQ) ATPase subunit